MRRPRHLLFLGALILALCGPRAWSAPADPADKPSEPPKAPAAKDAEKAKEPEKAEESAKAKEPEKAEEARKAAEAKESEKAEESASQPATVKVKKGPMKIEVTLDGVFEARQMTPIVLRPDEWSPLSVLSAVDHGATVKRGDVLASLDAEKLDRAIADLRDELAMTDLSIKQSEEELALLEKLTPLDLAATERTQENAREDVDFYNRVVRPLAIKSTEFSLRTAEQYVEYQKEELEQLEKMYKADDLTEETEQIVLRRARNNLDRARFNLETAKAMHEEAAKYAQPRRDTAVKEAAARVELQTKKAQETLPLVLRQKRLELEKAKLGRRRSQEKLDKLLSDRGLMTVKAPVDGVVYYGECDRGKWGSVDAIADSLRRGGTLTANKVFMTIVQPRPTLIRTSVPEKELYQVRAGVKGTAVPTGYPDAEIEVIVESVSPVPIGSGSFDARVTAADEGQPAGLMPGMTCKLTLVPYEKQDALSVPSAAVSSDGAGGKHYVFLPGKDGKPRRREVTIGRKDSDRTEIVSGLKEGDEILKEAPKED